MPLRLLWLAALRTDRAPARDDLHTPACQHPHLGARSPETDHGRGLLVILFRQQFLDEEHDEITFLVLAQTNFANAE